MAISNEKRESLIKWGLSPELLDRVEGMNKAQATDAIEGGVESKDVVEAVDAVVTPEPEGAEEAATEETEVAKEATPAVDKSVEEEILGVLQKMTLAIVDVRDRLESVEKDASSRMETIEKSLVEIGEADEAKIAQKAVMTPWASLSEMIDKSVVGKEETRVDGREKLAKSAPDEAEPQIEKVTGIDFLDQMIGRKG